MAALTEIGIFVLQNLGSLFLALVLIRFLLQVARADFYNPISQFMVKVTNPLLMPLRKMIPGMLGVDMASLVLALLVHVTLIVAAALLLGFDIFANPFHILSWAILGNVAFVVAIYKWSLFIFIIVSLIMSLSGNVAHMSNPIMLLLKQLTDPILRPFKRMLPDMGGFDISPIFAFLVLHVCEIIIRHLAAAAGISNAVASLVLGI